MAVCSSWALLLVTARLSFLLIHFFRLSFTGRAAGFCALCALQNHVESALQSTGKILTPLHFVKNLRCILSFAINLIVQFCFLCLFNLKVRELIYLHSNVDDAVLNCLTGISRSFRNFRQEDAHELMVSLLESMHKSCLPSGIPSESPSAYEKSLVHRIFGGRLRSQVYWGHLHDCLHTSKY